LNVSKDEIDIFEYQKIFELDHSDTVKLEKQFALVVVFASPPAFVNLAIEFYGQPFGGAIEIQNVAADTMLSTELSPIELRSAQRSPQSSFGRGQRFA
jgi:hypothetical protein